MRGSLEAQERVYFGQCLVEDGQTGRCLGVARVEWRRGIMTPA